MAEEDTKWFKWELTPFRIDSGGNWLFAGWPINGGWLPMIKFENLEGVRILYMEWLCSGIMFSKDF